MATHASLPSNWYEYLDPRGVPYYHNPILNITQWERPSAPSPGSLNSTHLQDRGLALSYKESNNGRSRDEERHTRGMVSLGEGDGSLSFLSTSTTSTTPTTSNGTVATGNTRSSISQPPHEGLPAVTLDLSKDRGSLGGGGQKLSSTRGRGGGVGLDSFSYRNDSLSDSVSSPYSNNRDGAAVDQRHSNPFISKNLSGAMEERGKKGWLGAPSSYTDAAGPREAESGRSRGGWSNTILMKFFPVCHSCFEETYGTLERLFDVTTEDMLLRLKLVLFPWKSSGESALSGSSVVSRGSGEEGGGRSRQRRGRDKGNEEECLSYHTSTNADDTSSAGIGEKSGSCFLEKPDLYGPFWTATTLVILFFACSNLPFLLFPSSSFTKAKGGGIVTLTIQGPDVRRLSQIAFSVYGCSLLPPLFCWLGLLWYKHNSSSAATGDEEEGGSAAGLGGDQGRPAFPKLEQLLCLQGYSLVPFCVAGLILLFLQGLQSGGGGVYFAVSVLRWGVSGVSAASAIFFLYVQLKQLLAGQEKRVRLVSSAVLIGAVVVLLAVLLHAVSVGQRIPEKASISKSSAIEGDRGDFSHSPAVVGEFGGEEEKLNHGDDHLSAKMQLTDTEEQGGHHSRSSAGEDEQILSVDGREGIAEITASGHHHDDDNNEAADVHEEGSASSRHSPLTAPESSNQENQEHRIQGERKEEGMNSETKPTEDSVKQGGSTASPGQVKKEDEDEEGKDHGRREGGKVRKEEGSSEEDGRRKEEGRESVHAGVPSAGQKPSKEVDGEPSR
ncbi:yip1 domain-containing protein [Cystoisospora suis]|uniref:Yip1 domain-containing protein n=1 Tax=Cystoisospora suis TaxID=483139 RepID=A0A2C6KY56_9APIC|nr:yip1 domain-containing protein [Cystoisospora suis]